MTSRPAHPKTQLAIYAAMAIGDEALGVDNLCRLRVQKNDALRAVMIYEGHVLGFDLSIVPDQHVEWFEPLFLYHLSASVNTDANGQPLQRSHRQFDWNRDMTQEAARLALLDLAKKVTFLSNLDGGGK